VDLPTLKFIVTFFSWFLKMDKNLLQFGTTETF